MNQATNCFNKVKKDCLQFIKTQETSTEKFKGKEKMIKSYLIPLCFWIVNKKKIKNHILLVWLEDKERERQL